MKIAFNPSTVAALTSPPDNKDITFDLAGHNIYARGVKFCGTPVVDNLTSSATDSSLSANMGRYLKSLVDNKADTNHNHDGRYLKLDGSYTMTGVLSVKADQYNDAYDGALNMNNSDIYGLNSIYTADESNSQEEGIHFWRSSTTVDTFRIQQGKMLFAPNRTLGKTATEYTVFHSGNLTYSTIGAAAASHNHTSLNSVTKINFNAQSNDSCYIGTTINGTSTTLDFYLSDDFDGESFRWIFADYRSAVGTKTIMQLYPTNNADTALKLYDSYVATQSWVSSQIPTTLKNPYPLTTFGVAYDGSSTKTVDKTTFISTLEEATATITDGTMLVTSYASDNGFADTNALNTPYKRKASCLWSYIKGKTDSSYITALGTSGNYLTYTINSNINKITVPYATSSGNADTLDDIHASGLLTAVTNPNTGISITVGGTTKTVASITANKANQLTNARTINGVSFDGSKNVTGVFTSGLHEAYLNWGGKNLSGTFGPIDAALVPMLGANRFAFGKPAGITITYSRDGGSTWTDYGASDTNKQNLFSPPGSTFGIGNNDSSNKATANYMLRVEISTSSFGLYTQLNKFVIYCNTNGSTGSYCTVEGSLQSTPTTFKTFIDKASISGWSGYNVLNYPDSICTYGNTPASQYGIIRFTFGCTGGSTTYTGLRILKIYGFGGVGWSTPSTLASQGTVYSIGSNQSVTFPGTVTIPSLIATDIYKSGGNASQLLRADGGVATFNWSGQSGQPTWLWGGNGQHTYYVYNPSNFNVSSAKTLTTARTFTISDGTNSGTATSFDGSKNVTLSLPSTIKANLVGSATEASILYKNDELVYNRNGLQYFNACLTTTGSTTENGTPTNDWYHILRMTLNNTDKYFVDIASGINANYLGYRRISKGVASNWIQLIDSTNIRSQSVKYATTAGTTTLAPDYLPLKGGKMTGLIYKQNNSSWYNGRDNSVISQRLAVTSSYTCLASQKTIKGDWTIGNYGGEEELSFIYVLDTTYNSLTNAADVCIKMPVKSGTLALQSDLNFLTVNDTIQYGANGLQYFNTAVASNTSPLLNSTPTGEWYHIIRMNHGNDKGFYTDVAFPLSDATSAYYCKVSAGCDRKWIKLIDSNNVISATAGSLYVDSTPKTVSATDYVTSMLRGFCYANSNGPTSYGNILEMSGMGGSQLAMTWDSAQTLADGTDTNVGKLFYRSRRNIIGGWSTWKQLAFADDMYRETIVDASSLSEDYYYVVLIKVPATHRVRINIECALNMGVTPSWATHSDGYTVFAGWETIGAGYGTSVNNYISREVFYAYYGFTNKAPVCGLGQMTECSMEYVYVRGGGKYLFKTSGECGTPILCTSTVNGSTYNSASTQTLTNPISISNYSQTPLVPLSIQKNLSNSYSNSPILYGSFRCPNNSDGDNNSIALWLGSNTGNTAPFQVTTEGALTAASGKMGGFSIIGNTINNIDTNNSAYILLKNNTTYTQAFIGGNTFSAASSATSPAQFINGQDNQEDIYYHLGVYAAAKGSSRGNYAFYASNGDLFMSNGVIHGFRLAMQQVSASSATLTATDSYSLHTSVMCTSSTADQTITLPSGAPVGQVFYLHQNYGRWIYIKASSDAYFWYKGNTTSQLTLQEGAIAFIMKIDSSHWTAWFMSLV